MKAKKAVKRLDKIKALISDVAKRYSATAPHLKEVLQYAEAAVTKAREAVGLHAEKAERAAKKAKPVHSKAAIKKVAVRVRARTSAKKRTPIKTVGKKRAAKRTVPAPAVQAAIS